MKLAIGKKSKVNNEIGSEFSDFSFFLYKIPKNDFLKQNCTFSGRTSLYLALSDIQKTKTIKKVWLPSYCCQSMVQPIIDLNLNYRFYMVDLDNTGKINREIIESHSNDVIILMSYFGFYDSELFNLATFYKKLNSIVIEDSTHSFLSLRSPTVADYQIASLRKWFPLASGGYITKSCENFTWVGLEPKQELIDIKRKAMADKHKYLTGKRLDDSHKKRFLNKFGLFESSLNNNYINKTIDPWSYYKLRKQNIDSIRKQRQKNARALLNGLKDLKTIQPLFNEFEEKDCPLFLPIITKNRHKLHKILIENNVFCPIHWPKPSKEANSSLYDIELSLICDQRYNEENMFSIIDVLTKFDKEH